MCKELWRRIRNAEIAVENYILTCVCRCFHLRYTPFEYIPPPVKAREPVYIPIEPGRNVYQQVRAWRVRNNGGRYTQAEWVALLDKYEHRCLRCGQIKPLSADHIIPVALGGHSNIDNIQPLCRSCNSWKGARAIDFRPE